MKDLKLEPRQKNEETESQKEGMTEASSVMGREERVSLKLGDTGVLGMVEVKVGEGGCSDLGLLEFLRGARFGLNIKGDMVTHTAEE